ncbi:drug/metabolite transporter permease [Vibrio cholerae]|nr:drug/metabolite transporter permease [Vibrio cholerae]
MWGYWILDEPIGLNTLFGTLLVLAGTMLVTGFSLRNARLSRQPQPH